jgi:hypothetical protein
MFLSLITLAVALSLSVIAAYYSIAGLAAIFAAAVIPIMIMGSILELAKVVVTIWLHEYWHRARWLMKLYLVPAVLMLMLITSMGIFGFLSKAHSDQSLVSGDVIAKIAVYDEKIKTEKENIDVSRKSLKQMDEAVDQVMGRSSDEKGADKAVAVRRGQQKERQRLLAEIAESQKRITALNEERAPIAAEVRKVEAEVGPIKYIAALIYGDSTDINVLERAVRWVIILLVCVFDPLAIMMLLAATESLKWAREKPKVEEPEKEDVAEDSLPEYDPDDGALTDDQLEQIQESAATDYQPILCHKCSTELINAPGIGLFCPNKACDVMDGPFSDDEEPVVVEEDDDEDSPELKSAKAQWKADHPQDSLKRQRKLLDMGLIDRLPWIDYLREPKSDFGSELPNTGIKGDTYVLTNKLSQRLYKHNGDHWISIDPEHYTYDTAYIEYLITQIEHGFYDTDMLTDNEREQIEQWLRNK